MNETHPEATEVTVSKRNILIVNNADRDVSWFCYNSNDWLKLIALASGNLSSEGGAKLYHPPKNSTDLYFVRFTKKGGGNELAGSTVRSNQTATLISSNGQYYIRVTDMSPSSMLEEGQVSPDERVG